MSGPWVLAVLMGVLAKSIAIITDICIGIGIFLPLPPSLELAVACILLGLNQ